jgi:hypothetical protein
VALLKPTIAGLFIVPLLLKKRWSLFVLATVYFVLSTAAVLMWTHTTPREFLHVWRSMSEIGINQDSGVTSLLRRAGLKSKTSMLLVGLVATCATVLGCLRLRHRSLPVLFAIAATGGRLWAYHSQYDNLMLVFLIVALGVALIQTNAFPVMAAFTAVGISLWAPAKICDNAAMFQLFQFVAWIYGTVVLAYWTQDEVNEIGNPPQTVFDSPLQTASSQP